MYESNYSIDTLNRLKMCKHCEWAGDGVGFALECIYSPFPTIKFKTLKGRTAAAAEHLSERTNMKIDDFPDCRHMLSNTLHYPTPLSKHIGLQQTLKAFNCFLYVLVSNFPLRGAQQLMLILSSPQPQLDSPPHQLIR